MKYKKIPAEYIKICIDRLTRFKPVYEKYTRVFNDILNKFLIEGQKKNFSIEEKCEIASEIFNFSIPFDYDSFISDTLLEEEFNSYYLNDTEIKLLQTKLNLTGGIKYIQDDNLPKNLKRLKILEKNRDGSCESLRKKYNTLFPINKIILSEGATEEILLPVFAQKNDYDFDKNGIFILGAGGKNQVARKYYQMQNVIKLPIFILLDSDAKETEEMILSKLKPGDKIHIIKNGEFEDILSLDLIINSINSNFPYDFHCSKEDFDLNLKMTSNLHELFKKKGLGEYKKADFAKIVKNYLTNNKIIHISSEIKQITEEIKNLS